MKARSTSTRKTVLKDRPDYYITPTRDFSQYTKDSEEKYWSKDTKFDWNQNVQDNLKGNLENLDPEEFSKILFMVLPMVADSVQRKIVQIRQEHLPLDEDALKDIAECIPYNRTTIQQALEMQVPLKRFDFTVAKLKDRLEILNSEYRDLKEQQRLGFYKKGLIVTRLDTDAEKHEQLTELAKLADETGQVQKELGELKSKNAMELETLRKKIRADLYSIEPQVLNDLEETFKLIRTTLDIKMIPGDPMERLLLKDLILKRQMRGLKDIANHALVVEQSAIAPLTMGIIHYKRHREIQEAMTTFIGDEAKHSATFRRYLVEKLEAKEFISDILIKGADRYMWLARFMPGAGLFLAVMVEAIGAAYLEFFADERYMPEKLFCSICKTISVQDESRHMDLCAEMYNELFRTGQRWEKVRNHAALKVLLRSVYGDKNEDHHLIQAFRAFGVEAEVLYRYITGKLSVQLARVSVYIEPDALLEIIGIARKVNHPKFTVDGYA